MATPQIKELIAAGFPTEITDILGKFAYPDTRPENWKTRYNGYNTTVLPRAIVLKDYSKLKNLISNISSISDGVKLVDIFALRYGIYSFNDSPSNLKSARTNAGEYSTSGSTTYTIVIEIIYNKTSYRLGINLVKYVTSQDDYSNYLNYCVNELPPKVMGMFDSNNLVGKQLIIDEFIKYCRERVQK
ncbi:hypothetical protein [Klebsiella variicola]|uniref:hypothetical protein n=1 Tax=Klebsiella variicola TaxID=244366 RepID=UPI000D745421|nr:hypothetical protein [Klebsiella variicola]PXM00360.1 hypothetical protein DMT40_26485 [Klebsiella variicola]